jgi:hypothetical protein
LIVDTNVNLSRWPFRRLNEDEPAKLVAKWRELGVTQAWAGTFDGLLHKDIAAANARLAQKCNEYGEGMLIPFGSINLTLPDWEEDVRRCHEVHHMAGVRLHPNYHGYGLNAEAFWRLLAIAKERRLIVQLVLKMEDERTQHSLMRVKAVDVAPLVERAGELGGMRLMILNGLRDLHGEPLKRLARTGRVVFDIGMLEGVGGVGRMIEQIGADRLAFGSHGPLFYPESAVLKLRESDLDDAALRGLTHKTAQELLEESLKEASSERKS